MDAREAGFRNWIGDGRDCTVVVKGADILLCGRLTQRKDRTGFYLSGSNDKSYCYFEYDDFYCASPEDSIVYLMHWAERQIRSQEEDAEETFGYGIDQARRALLAAGIPLDVIDSVVGVTAEYGSQAYMRGHSHGFNQGVQWQKERQ
jgi:hypothetical protein